MVLLVDLLPRGALMLLPNGSSEDEITAVAASYVRKGQEIIAHQRQRIAAVYLGFSPSI